MSKRTLERAEEARQVEALITGMRRLGVQTLAELEERRARLSGKAGTADLLDHHRGSIARM